MRLAAVAVFCAITLSSANARERYFPPGSLSHNDDQSEFAEARYSTELLALREVPLWPPASNSEVYRLTWLRSFHRPMVFRLDVLLDGTGRLKSREVLRPRRELMKKLDVEVLSFIMQQSDRPLPKEFVDGFKGRLVGIKFWETPSVTDGLGLDGSTMILEGVRSGEYHFVKRWNPYETDLGNPMLELMKKSGLDLEPIY